MWKQSEAFQKQLEAFQKTVKLTGLPSLKAATAQAAAGTDAFEIWGFGWII